MTLRILRSSDATPSLRATPGDRDGGSARISALRLRTFDAHYIVEWRKAVSGQGWTASAITRGTTHLKAFARWLHHGLRQATPSDVIAFAQGRVLPAPVSAHHEDEPAVTTSPPPSRRDRRSRDISRTVRSFYSLAATRGWIARERADAIKRILPEPVNGRNNLEQPGAVYERLLNEPSLTQREAAIIWLLAHGLGIAELVRLTPHDVNLDHAYVNICGPQRRRVVPLTPKAVARLLPWVTKRRIFGSDYLFPASRTEPLSDRTIRHVLKRVARRIYADRPHIIDAIHPKGFRDLYIRRALERRISITAIQAMTGLSRHSLIDLCLAEPPSMPTLRRELNRITRTSTRWI